MFFPRYDLYTMEVKFMFDNRGGCIAKFGENFWHRYTSMKRMFRDYYTYLTTGKLCKKYNDRRQYDWEDLEEGKNYLFEDRGEAKWYTYYELLSIAKHPPLLGYWSPQVQEFTNYIKKYQLTLDNKKISC